MLTEALRAMYGYNRWATERMLEAAAGLTPEQWLAPGVAGRGSVRDTLVHLISAQRSWLAWWDGSLPPDQAYGLSLDPGEFPDLAAVRAVWTTVDRATRAFVDGLSDSEAERVYTHALPNGMVFRLPLWQMMLHVANHGTQHRSEVAAMLTGFGQSPGDLDLLRYVRPFGDGRAV
jgi:uncharacterized damage-inducible protein DinB